MAESISPRNIYPQENKNLIEREVVASRSSVFKKAYDEIEEYLMTKKTPAAQEKPGEVIAMMKKKHSSEKSRKKKNELQFLVMEVP